MATRRGRRAGTRTLVLHLAPPSSAVDAVGVETAEPAARVGFAVSRAVGNSVARNRVKRRLRELTRARVGLLPPGSLLVVRALPASATASYAGLARDLDTALQRLDVPSEVSA